MHGKATPVALFGHSAATPVVLTQTLVVETRERFAFVDLTRALALRVSAAALHEGSVQVQTRHTTTALVVNENEPLLLQDLRALLFRLVPDDGTYAHDDVLRRGAPEDEPRNGAAHCRALLLPSTQSLVVSGGRLELGQWQSLFFVELDGPRRRTLSLAFLGTSLR